MLQNYLVITLRSLWKHKAFSFINLAGLAIGLATSLLILEYVSFERSYDLFHRQAADTYRIQYNQVREGGMFTAKATAPASVGHALLNTFPEVASVVRFHRSQALLSYEKKGQTRVFREENILAVDPSFLTFFSFPLLKGSPVTSLKGPKSIVITQALAQKYFGSTDPIGKVLKMTDGYGDWNGSNYQNVSYYTVTGVLANIPANSHVQIDALVSFRLFSRGEKELANWGDSFYTYIALRSGTSGQALEAKLPAFMKQTLGETTQDNLHLQPLASLHLESNLLGELGSNGSLLMVSVLLLTALIIVVIAWINYVNLTTARATERAKEVGIRKVTGASTRDLLGQFLLEAFIMNSLSLIIALGLVQVVQPAFNQLVGQALSLQLLTGQSWLPACVGLFLGGAFIASLYPIIVNTSFQPTSLLRGHRAPSVSGLSLRKSLVITQFVLSMIVVSGSLVMYRQMTFMQRYDVGMNLNQLLVLDGPGATDSTYKTRLQQFKSGLSRLPSVKQVAVTNLIPGKPIAGYSQAGLVRRVNQDAEKASGRYYFSQVDYDFPKTFATRLVAGRWFSTTYGTDAVPLQTVVINESAAKLLGYANPASAISQTINYRVQSTPTIVGVLKDYHHLSLKKTIDPIIFELNTAPDGYYAISLAQTDLPTTIAAVQQLWQATFPGSPFSYFFLNDYFNQQYQSDWRFTRVAGLFALLAITVASLGLCGLVLLMTTQRTKEIGVRKVLGASVISIVTLLSKDFLTLVLVALFIASPLAWWAMNKWLGTFAYKITIGWDVFALAGTLAVGIALLTVSFQSIRAALMNPMKSLRSE